MNVKPLSSTNLILLVVLFQTIFAPSCASQEERLQLAKQEVEVINSKLDNAEWIKGLAFRNENRYSYRAYFIDDELVYIFSDVNLGIASAASNYYYFHKGKLIYFKKEEVGFDNLESKKKRSIKIDIYFDGDEVLESTKIYAKNYDELTQEEIQAILEEAKKLYKTANEKRLIVKSN